MIPAHALAIATGLVIGLGAGPARAVTDWQPVPGAPQLQLELASMQARGAVVEVWVRGLGIGSVALLASHAVPPARGHRTLARLLLDCRTRKGQGLGVLAYDAAGRLVQASSVPSATFAWPAEGELAPVYDAACELARSQA